MSCTYYPYTLPSIDFVGGATQDLIFRAYNMVKKPADLSACTARFAIIDCVNRTGTPIEKDMEIVTDLDSNDAYANAVKVTLDPKDTVNLCGKYIYQITIKNSASGDVEIPNQGVMYITNNINKAYIG